MKPNPAVFAMALFLALMGATARADQIMLKNGTVYSGKFVRGDTRTVESRILGRVESFRLQAGSAIRLRT